MARKDLLKKAFHNNFIRKSVADLKSLASEKAHGNFINLLSPKKSTPSTHPASVRTITPDIPTPEPPHASQVSSDTSSASDHTVTSLDPDDSDPYTEPLRPGSSLRISTPELRRHDKKILEHGSNPMTMSASQIRSVMEQADAQHKARIRSAYALRHHDQLLADCRDMFDMVEDMVMAHLDTIETTTRVLDAMEGMSPHIEAVRREMVRKLSACEDQLRELRPVGERLERAKMGEGYA